jgi:hypothetical protein
VIVATLAILPAFDGTTTAQVTHETNPGCNTKNSGKTCWPWAGGTASRAYPRGTLTFLQKRKRLVAMNFSLAGFTCANQAPAPGSAPVRVKGVIFDNQQMNVRISHGKFKLTLPSWATRFTPFVGDLHLHGVLKLKTSRAHGAGDWAGSFQAPADCSPTSGSFRWTAITAA